MGKSFVLHTLGCPKNQVDSDKLAGLLTDDGLTQTQDTAEADLVVVNTCAFVEESRRESIETILALADAKAPGASLVVTGCLAERYGEELAQALPEADAIAGFGIPLTPRSAPAATGASTAAAVPVPVELRSSATATRSGTASAPAGVSSAITGAAPATMPVGVSTTSKAAAPAPAGVSSAITGAAAATRSGTASAPVGVSTTSEAAATASAPAGVSSAITGAAAATRSGTASAPVGVSSAITGASTATVPAVGSGTAVVSSAPSTAPTEPVPAFDLLNLPRPASPRPWAYVKIAEGCDRACGFCAIPGFRGPQRSRSIQQILAEVDQLDVREIVLVAQDLASYGRDQGRGERRIVPLVEAVSRRVERTRLLYLYPSDLNDSLIDAICATGVAYFDLSLQHVSPPLLRRMRRWGSGAKFLERIEMIRRREPDAAFRSNFIVGYPGETEADHDRLLRFVEQAELDWCGFFAYSEEAGTYSASLDGAVDASLTRERLGELGELQDAITARHRDLLVGRRVEVLVDEPGVGRTHREAPEIDGIVTVPRELATGTFATVTVTGAVGCDLQAT